MKVLAAALATGFLLVSATGPKAQETKMQEDVRAVAPALEKYTQDMVMGDLWKRPDLTPRDRSVVTLAALIARGETVELPRYLDLALDHGVKPREISEIITHRAGDVSQAGNQDADHHQDRRQDGYCLLE